MSDSSTSSDCFQSLDVTRFRKAVERLHEVVGCGHGRVEVTREGCDDVCVLVSKRELEALERALEILTECAEYKAMSEEVAQVAAAATSFFAPPPPTAPA